MYDLATVDAHARVFRRKASNDLRAADNARAYQEATLRHARYAREEGDSALVRFWLEAAVFYAYVKRRLLADAGVDR